MKSSYYVHLLASYIRGYSITNGFPDIRQELFEKSIDELSDGELLELYNSGKEAELKLYRFKNSHDELPRVKKVIGFLKGISFENLLDIGSGRGVFLFPFINSFPWVSVTSADILEHRVELHRTIALGGIDKLTAVKADICDDPFEENSFDVVTMLEVLEHIPDVEAAVKAAVKTAKKYVVVSVPSKPDNNPEHIHLLTKDKLTEIFTNAGCSKLSFDGVNGHLIMIAKVGN